MSDVDSHPAGTVSWVDLVTPDLEKARKFYGELFGWTFQVGGPETFGYTMCHVRGRAAAGMGQLQEGAAMPSVWTVYFATRSAAGSAASARELGGTVMTEAMEIPGNGKLAVVMDPTGAVFGLWEPGGMNGAQVRDEPGTMAWHEVATPDIGRAREFYGKLFSLRPERVEADGMEYWTLHLGERTVAGVGPTMPGMPPHWTCYFAVNDTDEALKKLKSLGGGVLSEPWDTPYGRMAAVRDPFGAAFHLMKPTELALSTP